MWQTLFITAVLSVFLWQEGEAILCHRCFSAMGGCGSDVDWRMFPWRDCGPSKFCVKVEIQVGSETKIIRECENNLMKSAYHRLRMPVLRRHGYCLAARKNDFWNPSDMEDEHITYCFCNDWNGCNSAPSLSQRIFSFIMSAAVLSYILKRFL